MFGLQCAASLRVIATVLVSGFGSALAQAEVTRLDVLNSAVLADELGFGARGVYEEVSGIVHFALDRDGRHWDLLMGGAR